MANMKGLENGLAGIITGASSGMGKALAIMLADKYGAKLVINARSEEALEDTASLVREHGGEATVAPGDISDRKLAESLVPTCLEKYGRLDLLVNNAGLAKPGPVPTLTPDDWERVFGVNFFAAVYTTYSALPYFIKQGKGKIVNISSVAGKVSFPGSVCYASTKFALTGMSLGMGAELARKGIDVITVAPGWVRTEFFEKNEVVDRKNPTYIAQRGDLKGWLMRNVLSISTEEAASDIIKACEKGGSSEIVLTAPGVVVERLTGMFPGLVQFLSKRIPAERLRSGKN